MRTRIKLALAIICLFAAAAPAVSGVFAAGTASNPLISRAYLTGSFTESFKKQAISLYNTAAAAAETEYVKKVQTAGDEAIASISGAELAGNVAASLVEKYAPGGVTLPPVNNYRYIVISADQSITARPGTVMYSPSSAFSALDGGFIALDTARSYATNILCPAGSRVMVSELGDAVIVPQGETLALYIMGEFTVGERETYAPSYTNIADALKQMGLFRGADGGYQLDRITLRTESLTMLVRLLGQEKEATAQTVTSPFPDTPAWFAAYARFSYANGLTLGVGEGLFGANMYTETSQYVTFILRALGYTDTGANPDFYYRDSISAAVRFGVLTQAEADRLSSVRFYRDQMVYISYVSLFANFKDSKTTLLQALIEAGAVDRQIASIAIASVNLKR